LFFNRFFFGFSLFSGFFSKTIFSFLEKKAKYIIGKSPMVLKIKIKINQVKSLFLADFHNAFAFHTSSQTTTNKINNKNTGFCNKFSINAKETFLLINVTF